jgi:hypothetical protein
MKQVFTFVLTSAALWFPMAARAVTLDNPLGESDPRLLIGRIILGALSISGSVALFMFVYGGMLWLTSMGRSEPIEKGRKILLWSVAGIVVIAGAFVMTTALFNAVTTGSVSGIETPAP